MDISLQYVDFYVMKFFFIISFDYIFISYSITYVSRRLFYQLHYEFLQWWYPVILIYYVAKCNYIMYLIMKCALYRVPQDTTGQFEGFFFFGFLFSCALALVSIMCKVPENAAQSISFHIAKYFLYQLLKTFFILL